MMFVLCLECFVQDIAKMECGFHDHLLKWRILQGPLMLEMNVLPDVAAATSATMILFTSLVGSLIFISFGAIG